MNTGPANTEPKLNKKVPARPYLEQRNIEILKAHEAGSTISDISVRMGLHRATVSRAIRDARTYPEHSAAIQKALGDLSQTDRQAMNNVRKAIMAGDMEVTLWYLERRGVLRAEGAVAENNVTVVLAQLQEKRAENLSRGLERFGYAVQSVPAGN